MASPDKGSPTAGQITPQTTAEIFAVSNIITVIVGEGKVKYALHESILKSRCPFFEKCLSSGMQEESEKTVRLPEERPFTFNVLVQWMYTDRVTIAWTDGDLVVSSYALADKFCMSDLQNAIVDYLRAGFAIDKAGIIEPSWLKIVWSMQKVPSYHNSYWTSCIMTWSRKPSTTKTLKVDKMQAFVSWWRRINQ